MGNIQVAMAEAMYIPPAAMMRVDESWTFAASNGAQIPEILFNKLAIPVPVPLLGAGKTSGLYAYRTPYMIFFHESANVQSMWIVCIPGRKPPTKHRMSGTPAWRTM